MKLEGPKLPRGWRYPAGRQQLKAEFKHLPGTIMLHHRPYMWGKQPLENEAGLLLEATYSRGVDDEHDEIRVYVYGVRDSEYPHDASREFTDLLLPKVASHFEQALRAETPADGFRFASYEIHWRDRRHQSRHVP